MIFFGDFSDFTNWAWYRQGVGKYEPEDIDPSICTHVVYAFAVLDESKLLIKPSDTIVDRAFYQKITALKSRGVKVTIGLGGWSDSHNGLVQKFVINHLKSKGFKKSLVESCQGLVVERILNFCAHSARLLRTMFCFVSVLY